MRENIIPIWPHFDIYPDNLTSEFFLDLIGDDALTEDELKNGLYSLFVHIEGDIHPHPRKHKQVKIIINHLDELAAKHNGRRMPGTGEIVDPKDHYILSSTVGYIFTHIPE